LPRLTALAASGQAFHEFLLAHEQIAELRARGVRFDAALDVGKFAFGSPVLQSFEAAVGFLLCEFAGIFKEDFEEQTAIAIFQGGADFGRLNRCAVGREIGKDEGSENLFGFESVM
jgi:hypothetical protein